MPTSLKQTGLQFPDNIIQTSNAANTLIGTAGGSFATALMNTQNLTPYRRCAVIMNDGRVRMWGYGGDSFAGFQRGGNNPYPIDIAFPYDFPGASSVTHSGTSGGSNWSIIDVNGKLWRFGSNDYGDVGVGNTTDVYAPINVSNNSGNSIFGKTVVQVAHPGYSEGAAFVLVRCSDGSVHTCGYNGYGQAGNGNTTSQSNFVQCIASGCTDIACGRENYTSCIAVVSGTVYTWGYNGDSQLGSGNSTNSSTPTARTGNSLTGKTITKVYGSRYTLYALASDGTFHGCGNQNDGQFGIGNTNVYNVWTQINTGVSFAATRPTDYGLTAVVKTDNTVWCAGNSDYWGLFNGYTYNQYSQVTGYTRASTTTWQQLGGMTGTPQKVLLTGQGNPKGILVLMTNGICYGYGYNGYGQLGNGTYADEISNVPANYPTSTPTRPNNTGGTGVLNEGGYNWGPTKVSSDLIADIAAYGYGAEMMLAILTRKGEVKSCGNGSNYANGNPFGNTYHSPTEVPVN